MTSYIVLLRGINVSGKNKVPMAELRSILENKDLANLQTYIQTGNILFNSVLDKNALKELIEKAIQARFGFEVPAVVYTSEEIQTIFLNTPFTAPTVEKSYFVFLFEKPTEDKIEEFQNLAFDGEPFFISSSCVYLNPENGYGNAKLNNNFFEKKLGVKATTRNYKTVLKLLSLCQ